MKERSGLQHQLAEQLFGVLRRADFAADDDPILDLAAVQIGLDGLDGLGALAGQILVQRSGDLAVEYGVPSKPEMSISSSRPEATMAL